MRSSTRRSGRLHEGAVADVDGIRVSYDAARFDFYAPDEVYALARAADSEQDAALFLTAAFAGLRRGELVARRWRDIDFEKRSIRVEGSFSHGAVTMTKGGRGRAVPLVAEVAQVLARLGQRGYATGRENPVFAGRIAGHLDASALRRRLIAARDAAGLRPLRFHDLRHPFGSLAINRGEPRAGAGADGPRGRQDDDALPTSQKPGERRRATRRRVPPGTRSGRRH